MYTLNSIVITINFDMTQHNIYVTGGRFESRGTTSLPKSVLRFVLDKARQVLVSEVFNSNVLVPNVPNKSLSQELNNVLFCSCCCKDEQMLL